MRKRNVAVLFALVVAALMSALLPAAVNEPVRTDAGLVSGTDSPVAGVRVFKGIPFAAPPVGDLRWRAPQPAAKWDGVKKADKYGAVCVQPPGMGRVNVAVDLPDSPPQSEDCLYLNVWTGAASASERRPVMVWIYGGAYSEGSGSSPHNDGTALAAKGVVLVSFNYRLGPFGFFVHPELTKESEHHASGNYAVMDTIAVLRWVKTNIAAFGGNPANVTIFGESAGAAMAAGLVGTPEAKELFHRAVSESGAWMGLSMGPMLTRERAEEGGGRGAAAIGATTAAALRAKSAGEVQKGLRGAGMIVDGWIVPEDESITFAGGRQNQVDVLVGSNKDEGSFVGRGPNVGQFMARLKARYGDLMDEALKVYPSGNDDESAASSERAFRDELAWHMRLYAERQAKIGKRAYLYYFAHEPPVDKDKRNLRATHTTEIPYVFHTLKAPRVYPDASSPELAGASAAEREYADKVSSYWVNFARTGDPNGKGLPAWPVVKDKATADRVMYFGQDKMGASAAPANYPTPEAFALYDAMYAKQMAAASAARR